MADDYKIHLNFLPLKGNPPAFPIFRKPREPQSGDRPQLDAISFKLPDCGQAEEDWRSYWILPESREGFGAFTAQPDYNHHLTCWMLAWSLRSTANETVDAPEARISRNRFLRDISFVLKEHFEGQELLVMQPYYLRATRQFGFLADFHFALKEGVPFTRKVQQLSLSLDKNYRRNLDCYSDRSFRIRQFLTKMQTTLKSLHLGLDGPLVELEDDFVSLPADRLRTKVYLFGENRQSCSQFTGLREHGPLSPLDVPPRLLFMFREQDRQAARRLALALQGTKQRGRFVFPGFKALFKTPLEIDRNPIVLPDLTHYAMSGALDRVKQERNVHPALVPVLVLPDGDDDGYLTHKALFTHAEIPTQACTLRILQDDDTLKWAIGSLALQIFCKAGGRPWKVRPTADRSLIIGISQSHKLREHEGGRRVEKYFAFSVLTDSSGLFQKIQVLGEADSQTNYIMALQNTLRRILSDSAQEFSRVVIHTSFKLKYREIDAIQSVVTEAAAQTDANQCRFAVVKVNHKCRFFGVNRSTNSLVPYEASRVRLGPGEYLVWFEGIFPDKPTVTKAFPGPTHLEFLRLRDATQINEDILLQDLVNLSGANWRGFNAKSAPISVFYCHLVADLVHDFHERGLPLPAVEDLNPWFL